MRRNKALPSRDVLAASRLTAALAVLVHAHAALAGVNFIDGDLISVAAKPDYMLAGDLSGDGLTDVVVVSSTSNEVHVFVASPDTAAHLVLAQALRFGGGLRGPALGDLNADGRLDLVVTDSRAKAVWVLLGQGDGLFADPHETTVPDALHPTSVTIGNFDDAGNPDLAVADERRGRVFILRNDSGTPPCFLPGGHVAVGSLPSQIGTADFNGDGKPDLATLNLGAARVQDVSIALWRRVSDGFPEFELATPYAVGERPSRMVIADFNDDDRPDIAMITRDVGGDVGEISALLNHGSGGLLPRTVTAVGCPFFTGGAPCRLLTLAAGDFDGNGRVDLVVGLSDPRRTGASAASSFDAMQLLAGRGDGRFVHGGVFAIQKVPLSMVAGMITGSGRVDLAVADSSHLQAFANVSRVAAAYENGHPCLRDEECLSSHCINGVCCATQCDPATNEVCNVPSREGICTPLHVDPVGCLPDRPECPDGQFCVDGFCCDQRCEDGRCDLHGFLGVCIPGVPDGQPCLGDDAECASGSCGDNFICCRESCEGGFCDSEGLCRFLLPNGNPCQENAECQSAVCDAFDAICCNRRCDPDTESCLNGTCGRFPEPARLRAVLTAAPCGGSCPSGTHRDNGVCVADTGGNGCSTVDGNPSTSTLSMVALLPLALWIGEAWRLSSVRRRRDQARTVDGRG